MKKIFLLLAIIFIANISVRSQCNCPLPLTGSYNWTPPICYSETISYNIPNAGFTSFWNDGFGNITPYIRYNPNIYSSFPDYALFWTRVHEYGHAITWSSNEYYVERWAARQVLLTDPNVLNNIIDWYETAFPFGYSYSILLAQNLRSIRGF